MALLLSGLELKCDLNRIKPNSRQFFCSSPCRFKNKIDVWCILGMIIRHVFCCAVYLLRTVCTISNFVYSFRSANPCISCKMQSLESSSLSIWVGKLVDALPDMRRSFRKVLGNRKNVFAKSRMFRINVSSNKSKLCQIWEGLPEIFWQTGKIYVFAIDRNLVSLG